MTNKQEHHGGNPLVRLLGPAEFEVSCERCFELLDEYVELELAGADADAHIPGLRTHLDGCPACREDHESLLALVASSDSPNDQQPADGAREERASG